MRRIRAAVGITLFMDSVLYLALVPFLPYYADKFDLSKAEAGLVLGALPVAILITAVPTGWLAGRVGARRVVIAGNVLFTIATLAFAFAPSVWVLVLARAAQGCANAACWGASMAWLTANAPAERRGETVGGIMGLVSAGSIAGPVFGVLGGWTSPAFAFSLIAVIGGVATVVTITAPTGREEPPTLGMRRDLTRAIRHPLVIAGLAVASMDAFCAAVVNLLGPLRLGADGWSEQAIAVPILLGSAIGWSLSAFAGRLSDRVGPVRVALVPGIGMSALCAALAIALSSPLVLFSLFILGPLFAFQATAVYPLCTRGADELGVPHGVVNGVMNLAWSGGLVIGQVAGGVLAENHGDAAAYAAAGAVIAVLLVITVVCGNRRPLALSI
jgi:MFS family permease